MGAAWRHVLMRLGKCVVSLPPLGRLQKKKKNVSEEAVWCFFFLGRRSLYFDSFICWVTHSLSVSLSLSAAGPDGALRKPAAQIEPSVRACTQTTQTHTLMCNHDFWKCLRKKNPKKRRFRGQTHLKATLPSRVLILHLLSPQEAWGECGPSLISPPPPPSNPWPAE